MKPSSAVAAMVFAVVMFLIASSAISDEQAARAKQGQEFHLAILTKHKRIDKFYRNPFVEGVLTANPLLCISVPEKDWESLPESKKQALAAYVASLIDKLKSDPFKYYNGVDVNAPAAPTARRNIERMSGQSWGIMVGGISPDGKDIMSDRIARSGK
jgi:hypothetical protein